VTARATRAPLSSIGLRVLVARARRRIAARPVRWILGYIAGVIVVAGVLYSILEAEANILDGVWWAIVTASTVGYGDIAPVELEGRLVAGWVILSGIATTAVLTALLAGWIMAARMADHLGTPDLDDDFDHLIDQLQALKARYERDESADDRIMAAARAVRDEWRRSPGSPASERAMADLAATLEHDH